MATMQGEREDCSNRTIVKWWQCCLLAVSAFMPDDHESIEALEPPANAYG